MTKIGVGLLILLLWQGLFSVTIQSLAAEEQSNSEGKMTLGTWVSEFRLCVQDLVAQGLPPEEARQSCVQGLMRAEEISERGTWGDEFRLCVQDLVAHGLPPEEARQSCVQGLLRTEPSLF